MLRANEIVGQSGGPTSAINATLSGVIKACLGNKERINTLYGVKNGIEGLLKDDIIELSGMFCDRNKLKRLEATPSSALGSCRMRLPESFNDIVYRRIFDIFKKYGIGYFFYIGGNDSMDTVSKLDKYARTCGYGIRIIGIPKTIDNDLTETDHTPGYGSAAKYIATTVSEILRDCASYTVKAVTVIEIMGRDAGWLTCAASLPKAVIGEGVDLIYLPERTFSMDKFISSVNKALERHPNVVIAVSEGIRYENGAYVGELEQSGNKDVFGHKYLAGVSKVLSRAISENIGCKVRAIELNLLQRCAAHLQSAVDISESIRIGKAAVERALKGESGRMISLERRKGKYSVRIKSVDIDAVANKVRYVPCSFINKDGNYVTKECIEYLLPLVLGETKKEYKNGLPVYCIIK